MQWTGVIRDVTLIERTNQLNLLPDKDLVDLCPPIEPYQVTKNQNLLARIEMGAKYYGHYSLLLGN